MEAKMAEVLAKISELQSGAVNAPEKDSDRVQALEKQLADATEKRIEYMEKLQEQQMAMQVWNIFFYKKNKTNTKTRSIHMAEQLALLTSGPSCSKHC